MATSPTAVADGPAVPDSSVATSTFDAQYEAFNTWEKNTLRPGMNALAAATYANALEAEADALAAANSASAAATSAIAAGATNWVSGESFNAANGVSPRVGDARISQIDFQTYRRKTAGAGTTDPKIDNTNWEKVGISGFIGTVPIGGLLALPTASANLVTGATGEKYMRSGVVDLASSYPLAPSEFAVSMTLTATAAAMGLVAGLSNNGGHQYCFGNGVFVRWQQGSAAAPRWSVDGITWNACTGTNVAHSTASVGFDAVKGVFYAMSADNGTVTSAYASLDGKAWFALPSSGGIYFGALVGLAANNGNMVSGTTLSATVAVSLDSGATLSTRATTGVSGSVGGAVYNPTIGLFAVAGQSTAYCTSPTGDVWTGRTAPATIGAPALLRSAGTRFFCASTTQLYATTDGISWGALTVPGFTCANNQFSITHNGSLYSLLSAGQSWTSPDATTWTARVSPFATSLGQPTPGDCAFGNGINLVHEARYSSLAAPVLSTDGGITYAEYGVTRTGGISDATQVHGDGTGKYTIGTVASPNTPQSSVDGVNWVVGTSLPAALWSSAKISNGLYFAMKSDVAPTVLYTSADGINYTSRTVASPGATHAYLQVAYGAGFWVVLPGYVSGLIAGTTAQTCPLASAGATWSNRTIPSHRSVGVTFSATANKFASLGYDGDVIVCTGAPTGTWTTATASGLGTAVTSGGIVTIGASTLVAYSTGGRTYRYSTDWGVTWSGKTLPGLQAITAIVLSGDGKLYSYSSSTGAVYSSVDGNVWVFEYTGPVAALGNPNIAAAASGVLHYDIGTNLFSVEYQRRTRVANSVALYPSTAANVASTTSQMYMRVA